MPPESIAPPSLIPTTPGIGPSPPVARVLQEALSREGQRETGGENRGPIVVWSLEKWISPDRLGHYLAPPEAKDPKSGKGLWCAGFACRCWLEAWPGFKPVGTGSCTELWKRCEARGWTIVRGINAPSLEPGDLLIHGTALKKTHTDLVTGFDPVTQMVLTIGGNVGNKVARRKYHLPSAKSIYGWARPRPDL